MLISELFLYVSDMSQEMAINAYDIVSTLQALGMMKYWKGKHIILKRQVRLLKSYPMDNGQVYSLMLTCSWYKN